MAYATEAELTTYTAARGITLTGLNGTPAQILVKAHDYIESKQYKGSRYVTTQTDSFPRSGVYVDGILIDETITPDDIINAELRVAIEIDAGNDPLVNLDRKTIREKLGDLEVEYSPGSRESVKLSAVDALLDKYIYSNAGQFTVARG